MIHTIKRSEMLTEKVLLSCSQTPHGVPQGCGLPRGKPPQRIDNNK